MLICFHASAEAKNALDGILARGQGRDISEAISMALVNYNVLAQTVAEGGQVWPTGTAPQTAQATAMECIPPPLQTPKPQVPRTVPPAPEIPEDFRLRIGDANEITLLDPAPPPAAKANDLAPAEWLFGQFNKFLAPKATCRALMNLLIQSPAGIPIAEASNKISYAACTLGDYLQRLDHRLQSRREDAFAAAFPSSATADGGGESRLRFANQFVAHIRQDQLGGFPAALRLVAMATAKDTRLSLTKAGAEFAMIQNPVLDAPGTQPTRKLSQPEIEFLLSHIIASVPEETSAYASILDAIQSGANTPDSVDRYLRQRFKLPTEQAITKTFLTTQRTGAISRMADLGLIAREKQGLRVTYLVTPQGTNMLTRMSTPPARPLTRKGTPP